MSRLFPSQKSHATWNAVNLLSQADAVEADATTVCYFMVEHISDEKVIQELATRLIKSGCREFHFWGKHEAKWHFEFDATYIQLNPDFDENTVAITFGCPAWKDLVEDVVLPMIVSNFVPTRFVLFYDDEERYQSLCRDCEAYTQDEDV